MSNLNQFDFFDFCPRTILRLSKENSHELWLQKGHSIQDVQVLWMFRSCWICFFLQTCPRVKALIFVGFRQYFNVVLTWQQQTLGHKYFNSGLVEIKSAINGFTFDNLKKIFCLTWFTNRRLECFCPKFREKRMGNSLCFDEKSKSVLKVTFAPGFLAENCLFW